MQFRGTKNKRRRRDDWRGMVCMPVFKFWHGIGRPLSYTTDPETSERRGVLIEFVNAVVGCVTDPPARLNGETLRREIEKGKYVIAWTPFVNDLLARIPQAD